MFWWLNTRMTETSISTFANNHYSIYLSKLIASCLSASVVYYLLLLSHIIMPKFLYSYSFCTKLANPLGWLKSRFRLLTSQCRNMTRTEASRVEQSRCQCQMWFSLVKKRTIKLVWRHAACVRLLNRCSFRPAAAVSQWTVVTTDVTQNAIKTSS